MKRLAINLALWTAALGALLAPPTATAVTLAVAIGGPWGLLGGLLAWPLSFALWQTCTQSAAAKFCSVLLTKWASRAAEGAAK